MASSALTLYRQGLEYLREGHFDQAADILMESIRVDREFLDAYYHLALAVYRAGDLARAEKILDRLVEAAPEDVGARLLLSQVRRGLDDRAGSERALTPILAHRDLTEKQVLDISYELLNIGRRKLALRLLRREVRRHPDNVNLLYRLGRTLADLGQNKEALKRLVECVQVQPDHADAKRSIDRLLRETLTRKWGWIPWKKGSEGTDKYLSGVEKLAGGDARGAAAALSDAEDSGDPGLLLTLACAYENEGSEQAAIEVLEQIRDDPDVGSFASYRLARLYVNLGNHEEATLLLRAALNQDPDFEEAEDLLAEILLDNPETQE